MDTPQQQQNHPGFEINLSSAERTGSVIGGALLTLFGLRRRSTFGALAAIAGVAIIRRGMTGHCELYAALGKNSAEGQEHPSPAAEPQDYFQRGIHVERSITVNRPAGELFRFWHDFQNLPSFMEHLQSVTDLGSGRSRWVAKGPAGTNLSWVAEIINEEADRLIAWRSVEGADVDNAGSVRFLDSGNGSTEVRVVLDYIPPAGKIGGAVAAIFGEEPSRQIADDLRNFKRVTEGQSQGAETEAANPT